MAPQPHDLVFDYFPIFFIGMWLAVTTLLGVFSNWFALQKTYPAPEREPLLTLRLQSGSMGMVSMRGCLRLSAYPEGMGVGILRLLGPFEREFVVPWKDVHAEESRIFLSPAVKLRFGHPQIGSLKISDRSWQRLAATRGKDAEAGTVGVTTLQPRPIARALVLEWLIGTSLAALFFYLAPRLQGFPNALPLVVCIAFPAVVLGIGQVIRYLRGG